MFFRAEIKLSRTVVASLPFSSNELPLMVARADTGEGERGYEFSSVCSEFSSASVECSSSSLKKCPFYEQWVRQDYTNLTRLHESDSLKEGVVHKTFSACKRTVPVGPSGMGGAVIIEDSLLVGDL